MIQKLFSRKYICTGSLVLVSAVGFSQDRSDMEAERCLYRSFFISADADARILRRRQNDFTIRLSPWNQAGMWIDFPEFIEFKALLTEKNDSVFISGLPENSLYENGLALCFHCIDPVSPVPGLFYYGELTLKQVDKFHDPDIDDDVFVYKVSGEKIRSHHDYITAFYYGHKTGFLSFTRQIEKAKVVDISDRLLNSKNSLSELNRKYLEY